MMFLVIFSSLAAAMAVVAQGNLRTADSYLKVSRAMSAAETGLVFAQRRLASESSRFVVKKGVIDKSYGDAMWDGSYDPADVTVLPPSGFTELNDPVGVAEALLNAHLEDLHTFLPDPGEPGDANLPEIDNFGTLRAAPSALMADADGLPQVDGPYFRLTYQPYDIAGSDDSYILVTSVGYDRNITRTLQMLFQIDKKIEFAIIAPSRIMIGKNVRIEGPLGTVYGTVAGELDTEHGDPLVIRSDFYYLHANLNANLDIFFAQLALHDADGDGRLRLYHPTEQLGIAVDPAVMADSDGNEYVDDFDLFLAHYDLNPTDGRVVYSAALSGEAEEFFVDGQLARLIDEAYPDRDGDGFPGTASDTSLGWKDGVLDIMDTYAKVRGRLAFSVARADWELGHGESYQTVVQGPITPGLDEAPVTFEAPEEVLRLLDTSMFDTSATWYEAQVPGTGSGDFDAQVAAGQGAGGTYDEPAGFGDPAAINWESIPLNAQGAYDHYDRPIYRDMTFTNVRIPMGNNGLYENCTFIGVTFIECEPDCTEENWNYAGALTKVDSPLAYELKFTIVTELSDGTIVPDSKVMSNNIRFDSCTFIGTISGTKPGVLADDNPYTHWRNKIQLTGATRFYIEADDPDLLAEAADNPILVAQIQAIINGMAQSDLDELRKSSILLPGWSADIGSFTNEQDVDPELTPKVKLKGTIVAGILDVRGTADIHGTLLMTYQPLVGEGPLFYGGLTNAFNTTIGYFGPADGDGEGTDDVSAGFGELTLRYDPDADLPDGIPWPIRIDPDPVTYTEGGGL
jgi:hypothetical protein